VTPRGEAVRCPQAGSVCVVRTNSSAPAVTRLTFPQPVVLQDASRRCYEIRVQPCTMSELHRMATAAQDTTTDIGVAETGGLLLGQFDDASRVVWVSEVTGPPAGSTGTPLGFRLNTPEATAQVNLRSAATRGAVRLIGYWHTHPNGNTRPSADDLETMRTIDARQRLMLIVSGTGNGAPNDVHAEVFFASDGKDNGRRFEDGSQTRR
jgi:integrative and conjugative element protein (TIGR02256 family)